MSSGRPVTWATDDDVVTTARHRALDEAIRELERTGDRHPAPDARLALDALRSRLRTLRDQGATP